MILLKRIILLLVSAGSCITIFGAYSDPIIYDEVIVLPYIIEGTELILESIGSGNSEYTEAVFYNSGMLLIESFYVEIFTECGLYYFETTMLPPGERILLRDRDGKAWNNQLVTGGKGYYKTTHNVQSTDLLQARLFIYEELLIIDNSHKDSVKMLDVYLKKWDHDSGMYGSDKTRKISVRDLNAGDVLKINLSGREYRIVFIEFSE